jgi:hypothetical protein
MALVKDYVWGRPMLSRRARRPAPPELCSLPPQSFGKDLNIPNFLGIIPCLSANYTNSTGKSLTIFILSTANPKTENCKLKTKIRTKGAFFSQAIWRFLPVAAI